MIFPLRIFRYSWLVVLHAAAGRMHGQEQSGSQPQTGPDHGSGSSYRVEASLSKPTEGGAALTVQRVARPVPSESPVAASEDPPSGRGTAEPPPVIQEVRLLFPTVTLHEGGMAHIEWSHNGISGIEQNFEGWTNVDLSAIWMVSEVRIGQIRYLIFPLVLPENSNLAAQHAFPDPAEFEGNPADFFLTQGDSAETDAIEPVKALLGILSENGEHLAGQLQMRKDEAERLSAIPPPPAADSVIRLWPVRSRRYPSAR